MATCNPEERFAEAMPLARATAAKYFRRCGGAVPLEDLVSWGAEGLWEAARRFDDTRGVPFRCYALLRIRGAIVDAVRRSEVVPRRGARNRRLGEQELGLRQALFLSTCEALGSLRRWAFEGDEATALDDSPEAEAIVGELESRRQLSALIARLPKRERELVQRHYFGEDDLQDVAKALGISKSRTSHIHLAALARLRAKIQKEICK